jgi:transposase-like protein
MKNPFRYFNSSPEVIRLAVMMYIRYPLSLRQVEDLLFERSIDICHGWCQSNANQSPKCWALVPSGRQLTPFSQSG